MYLFFQGILINHLPTDNNRTLFFCLITLLLIKTPLRPFIIYYRMIQKFVSGPNGHDMGALIQLSISPYKGDTA